MSDAEADAPVVGAEMAIDAAQTVMTAGAPTLLHPQLAEGEVDLVMDDDDLLGSELVEVGGCGYGLAGQIHVGLGLEYGDLFVGDGAVGNHPAKLAAEGTKAMAANDRVRRHRAD